MPVFAETPRKQTPGLANFQDQKRRDRPPLPRVAASANAAPEVGSPVVPLRFSKSFAAIAFEAALYRAAVLCPPANARNRLLEFDRNCFFSCGDGATALQFGVARRKVLTLVVHGLEPLQFRTQGVVGKFCQ